VHAHDLPDPPPGQRLPLFVLVSRRNDVVVIEGLPDYEELRDLLLRLAGEPSGR
jgi:hypothetical protein